MTYKRVIRHGGQATTMMTRVPSARTTNKLIIFCANLGHNLPRNFYFKKNNFTPCLKEKKELL